MGSANCTSISSSIDTLPTQASKPREPTTTIGRQALSASRSNRAYDLRKWSGHLRCKKICRRCLHIMRPRLNKSKPKKKRSKAKLANTQGDDKAQAKIATLRSQLQDKKLLKVKHRKHLQSKDRSYTGTRTKEGADWATTRVWRTSKLPRHAYRSWHNLPTRGYIGRTETNKLELQEHKDLRT